jgi:hypothetical protein
MAVAAWHYVEKGKRVGIFVNLVARQVCAQNPGKDVVIVIAHGVAFRYSARFCGPALPASSFEPLFSPGKRCCELIPDKGARQFILIQIKFAH